MKWKKFTLHTNTEAVDLISAALSESGIEGIEIEDKLPLSEQDTAGMFIDILPDALPDDGKAIIHFYLDPDSDIQGTLSSVRESLSALSECVDIGDGVISESETEDKDWINNWKTFFHPFLVEDILIKPTWEAVPCDLKGNTVIEIDPGTAFGTGAHETTQLCILQLSKYLKRMNPSGEKKNIKLLDVGTGSGILGITALKRGASFVFATDLDENALHAVCENLKSNHLSEEQFHLAFGNLIDDEALKKEVGTETYDIAVANILAPVIIDLQKEIFVHLRHGGIFITSGIIDSKEKEVLEAFSKNAEFEVLEVNHLGEWVNVTARRR